MSQQPIISTQREIDLIDFALAAFPDSSLAEKIELLGGLADGRHSPETHWPLFWNTIHELSLTPKNPCDRNAIAKTLIQAYHRLTPEQQFVICKDEFEPRKQWVLVRWVEEWQEYVLKQTVGLKNQAWD